MEKFRISNDLSIFWSITNKDGSPYTLSDKTVRLFVTHPRGRVEVTPDITIQDNVICWLFRGSKQRYLGTYRITAEIQATPADRTIRKDIPEAFELVSSTQYEQTETGRPDINEEGELTLATSLDIFQIKPIIPQVGPNRNWWVDGADTGKSSVGLTAYEFAKEQGYEGTVEEYEQECLSVPYYNELSEQATKQSIAQQEEVSSYMKDVAEPTIARAQQAAAKAEQAITSIPKKTSQLVNDSGFITKEGVPASDWNASTYQEGHIKNRTHHMQDYLCHYFKGAPIKISKPSGVGYVLLTYDTDLADKFIRIEISAAESKTHEFLDAMGMPIIFRWDAGNSTINVESFADAVEAYGMRAYYSSSAKSYDEYFVTLDDGFIPESVARKSEIATINGESITEGGNIVIEGAHNIGSIDLFEQIIAQQQNYDLTQEDKEAILNGKVITTSAGNGVVPTISSNSMGENGAVLIFHFNERLYEMFVMWTDTLCYINGVLSFTKETKLYADSELSETSENAVQNKVVTEKLTQLSADVKNVSGVYTLDFEVKASGVNPSTTSIEYPANDVVYVGVEDKDNCIKYLYFYGYKADGTSDIIVGEFISNRYFKFDGRKYAKVGVYFDSDMVAFSGVATLKVLVGTASTIEQIKTEASIDEQITIIPTIARDGYYIDANLAVAVLGAYVISAPIFLKKGDKVFYKAFAKGTFAQLSECDENGVLLELLQNGTGDRPFYHNYIAPKDMYICICSTKANIGDVVIQRNIKESISLVEEKISKRVTALEGTSVLKDRKIQNLCDISKAKIGTWVKYDGSEGTSNSHRASDFIPVVYGETYSMPVDPEYFGAANAARITIYNSNKEYIGGISGTMDGIICTIKITNASAAYIRTTIRDVPYSSYKWGQNFDTYMVVNSDKYPSRYIPYGDTSYYADYELAPTTNEIINPLFGKSVVFDGDSICNALSEGTSLGWAGRIGRKNMMLWQNYAIGGGTITSISGKHVISTQSYDNANPDYIIIEGGTNDADLIGSILNGQTPAAYGSYEPNGYDGDYDNTTFCGAVEFLFKRLLTTYPSAKIGVIIAPKMSVASSYTKEGNNRRAYFETLMQLCKKWGIPYLNLWDRGRLNPALSVFYNDGEDSFYTDGQHLTAKGYDVITPMIEEWMKTL